MRIMSIVESLFCLLILDAEDGNGNVNNNSADGDKEDNAEQRSCDLLYLSNMMPKECTESEAYETEPTLVRNLKIKSICGKLQSLHLCLPSVVWVDSINYSQILTVPR